ncbi:MAG: hypothetical protein M3O92_01015 [Actinomycetota bacterium]|nr:hypothetical protein [Actinomycetota bacterium]
MVKLVVVVGVVAASLAVTASAGAANRPIHLVTTVSPGPHFFGDPIHADVDILIDTKRVDPKAVRLDTKFDPYTRLARPQRIRSDDGSTTRLRYLYLLTCDTFVCLTGDKTERTIHFAPATIRYRDRHGKEAELTARWPRFRFVSRFGGPRYLPQTASEVARGIQYSSDPIVRLFASIRAPSPSYRLNPIVLAVLLFAAALAALLAAGALARPLYALVRRQDESRGPALTPLEQALAAVDAATRRQPGSAEHRESLAWLGRELRRTNLTELVGRARRLAWSEQAPTADASRELTADVEAGRRNGA